MATIGCRSSSWVAAGTSSGTLGRLYDMVFASRDPSDMDDVAARLHESARRISVHGRRVKLI